MEDKLRNYIDNIFSGCNQSPKALELREEMLQNLSDKYQDLISEGKTPEAAYNIAVAGIGDASSLLRELEAERTTPIDPARLRKSALIKAGAIMLYIMSVLPLVILGEYGGRHGGITGFVALIIMVATATGLLIYNSAMTKDDKYHKNSVVDDFRRWQTEERDKKAMRGSISLALWSVILVLYFVLSFVTYAWHITWLIFIVGIGIEAMINVFVHSGK